MNSTGDLSECRLAPFVKDAYLRWASGAHAVLVGISPTPTFEFIESFWGYRSVEKTPLDLQKWDGSRDFGVAAMGTLDKAKTVYYNVMLGNGSDTGSETDKSKSVRGSFGYRATSGFVAEGYVDWQDKPKEAARSTMQAFSVFASRPGVSGSSTRSRSAVAQLVRRSSSTWRRLSPSPSRTTRTHSWPGSIGSSIRTPTATASLTCRSTRGRSRP